MSYVLCVMYYDADGGGVLCMNHDANDGDGLCICIMYDGDDDGDVLCIMHYVL